ncbi:hypothetical protein BH23PLA1_BH23PLA1_41770 [soil metagenome]
MRRTRIARGLGLAALAALVGVSGCTHNHYYGQVPASGVILSSADPAVLQYGSVCDLPGEIFQGGTTVITQAPASPRVVISQPAVGGSGGMMVRQSRGRWFQTESDRLATTEVRGAIDPDASTLR